MQDLNQLVAGRTLELWGNFRLVDREAAVDLATEVAACLGRAMDLSRSDIEESLRRPERMVRTELGPLGERQDSHVRGFFTRLTREIYRQVAACPEEVSKAA